MALLDESIASSEKENNKLLNEIIQFLVSVYDIEGEIFHSLYNKNIIILSIYLTGKDETSSDLFDMIDPSHLLKNLDEITDNNHLIKTRSFDNNIASRIKDLGLFEKFLVLFIEKHGTDSFLKDQEISSYDIFHILNSVSKEINNTPTIDKIITNYNNKIAEEKMTKIERIKKTEISTSKINKFISLFEDTFKEVKKNFRYF